MYMWECNMKILTKLLVIAAGLLFGFATCASAQVTWTLSDVTFSNGNVAMGSFTTNAATDDVLSFSIAITGPDTAAAFTAAVMLDTSLPGHIGLGGPGFSQDVLLTLLSDMTNAGGTIPIVDGVDCPPAASCGTLVTTGHSPEIIGVTPEPATAGLMLLGLGIMVSKYVVRRRQQSTETLP
jgi:hypothetical protein